MPEPLERSLSRKWDTVSVCEDDGCGHCLRCMYRTAVACQIEAETLLDEFDRYATNEGGAPYAGSPFQKRVHVLLKPRWKR